MMLIPLFDNIKCHKVYFVAKVVAHFTFSQMVYTLRERHLIIKEGGIFLYVISRR